MITVRPKNDSLPAVPLTISNLQGIGARSEQQDAFALSPLPEYPSKGFLAVLCDGMGGMSCGKAIAQRAVSAIMERFTSLSCDLPGALEELVLDVNRDIYAAYRGIGGSTLVLAYIVNGKLWFLTAGDSDLLLLRGGRLYAVNCRHEYRYDLYARVLRGESSIRAACANAQAGSITQFLGSANVQCDGFLRPLALCPDDRLLLCSDGVSDVLNLAELESALRLSPSQAAQVIERQILAAGAPEQDNYTAVMIQYTGQSDIK